MSIYYLYYVLCSSQYSDHQIYIGLGTSWRRGVHHSRREKAINKQIAMRMR